MKRQITTQNGSFTQRHGNAGATIPLKSAGNVIRNWKRRPSRDLRVRMPKAGFKNNFFSSGQSSSEEMGLEPLGLHFDITVPFIRFQTKAAISNTKPTVTSNARKVEVDGYDEDIARWEDDGGQYWGSL